MALDPCSGSETFIIVLIKKVLESNVSMPKNERLHDVLTRVKALDLNPLAVLTTRINYFINVAFLISDDDKFEIPVYLGDSSYVPEPVSVDGVDCLSYQIKTLRGYIVSSLIKSYPQNLNTSLTKSYQGKRKGAPIGGQGNLQVGKHSPSGLM
jgi:hypothetical protein